MANFTKYSVERFIKRPFGMFVILMKISSKMAFENFKNFISFHETFKTKFSTHISNYY